MRETPLMAEKKERSRQLLAERYYGKKDLLKEWSGYEHLDRGYVFDLNRRIRGYALDLAYRGHDNFTETNQKGTTTMKIWEIMYGDSAVVGLVVDKAGTLSANEALSTWNASNPSYQGDSAIEGRFIEA